MKTESKYYLINSGPMLEHVKAYIQSRLDVQQEVIKYCEKMGCESFFRSGIYDDYITGLCFSKKPPEGWTKPKKNGYSRPKKNSPDYEEFNNLPRALDPSKLILDTINLSLNVSYTTETGSGCCFIGDPFNETGFLYIHDQELYAFWIPDVEAACKYHTEQGHTITNGIDKWEMKLDGVELISKEKWQYLVAKAEFEKTEADKL
jgi:hypothetical protein